MALTQIIPRVIFAVDMGSLTFSRWYSSYRVGVNNWTPRVLFHDDQLPGALSDLNARTCSSGAVTPALANRLGVIAGSWAMSLYPWRAAFMDNGLPTIPEWVGGTPDTVEVQVFDWWSITQGAFWFGSRYRAVVRRGIVGSYDYYLSVFLRPDPPGAAWTEPDTAGASRIYVWGRQAVWWNGVSNLINCLVLPNDASTIDLIDYNMTTDLWTAPFGTLALAAPILSSHDSHFLPTGIVKLPNGDTVIFYSRRLSGVGYGAPTLLARYYSAGVWGNEVAVTDSPNTADPKGHRGFSQVILGVDGETLHVFFYKRDINNNIYGGYQQMKAGVLVGSPHIFPYNSGIDDGLGHGIVFDDNIIVGFDDWDTATPGNRVYVGTPLSSPVWTEEYVSYADTSVPPLFFPTCTYVVFGEIELGGYAYTW